MKKLISSRRGAAIELAIGVMFVMIALSIILVTNASLQNKEMKSDVADLEQKIELMEITDYIINNPEEVEYNSYDIACEIKVNSELGIITRTYIVSKDGEKVLSFVATKATDETEFTITSWN